MDAVCSSFEFAKTLHFLGLFHSLFSLDKDLCCSPVSLLRALQSDDDWMLVLIRLYKALPSGQRLSAKDPLLLHISKEYARRELDCFINDLNATDSSSIASLSLADRLLLASDCCEFLLQDVAHLRSLSNFTNLPAMDADSEMAGYQLWTNSSIETSSKLQSFFVIAQSALYRVLKTSSKEHDETWELIAWDLPTWTAVVEKPSTGITDSTSSSSSAIWLVDLHKSRKAADKQAISRLQDLFEICRPDLEAIQRRILAREKREQEVIRQAYFDQTRRKSSRIQRLHEQAEEERFKQEAMEAELAQQRAEELLQERLERAKRVGVQLSSNSMQVVAAASTVADHQLSRAERVALRNQRIAQAKDDALLEQLEHSLDVDTNNDPLDVDDNDPLDVDSNQFLDVDDSSDTVRASPVKLVLRLPSIITPTNQSCSIDSPECIDDISTTNSSIESTGTLDTKQTQSDVETKHTRSDVEMEQSPSSSAVSITTMDTQSQLESVSINSQTTSLFEDTTTTTTTTTLSLMSSVPTESVNKEDQESITPY